jgi:2,3-diaminopropionate biosynthesis protein SbnB
MDKSIKFIYLQQEDVIACGGLEMRETIEAVEKVYSLRDRGECIEPGTLMITYNGSQGRRIMTHEAFVGGDVNVAGIKWIPSSPDNPFRRGLPRASAIIILNDPETGFPLAVMDGTVVSAMRTAAATGVGAKYLARKDSKVVGLIGTGPINRSQIRALREVLPELREVKTFDLRADRAQKFAQDMEEMLGIPFRVAGSAEEAVTDSDVVVAATVGVTPENSYIEASWLKEGSFLSSVSASDAKIEVVLQADKRVVTDRHVPKTPTWLIGLICTRGLLSEDDLVEIGEIINGKQPGRENDRERIYYNPTGLGVEDVIAAHRVYQQAVVRGIGRELELWHDPIWV